MEDIPLCYELKKQFIIVLSNTTTFYSSMTTYFSLNSPSTDQDYKNF